MIRASETLERYGVLGFLVAGGLAMWPEPQVGAVLFAFGAFAAVFVFTDKFPQQEKRHMRPPLMVLVLLGLTAPLICMRHGYTGLRQRTYHAAN